MYGILWWGFLFIFIIILYIFIILIGLRFTFIRSWFVKNGGFFFFSSILMFSSESFFFIMIFDFLLKFGSFDLLMTFAAIICWISNFSGEDMRWYRRFFLLASSMFGICFIRGIDEGRLGFLVFIWLLWIFSFISVFVFDGFRFFLVFWSIF